MCHCLHEGPAPLPALLMRYCCLTHPFVLCEQPNTCSGPAQRGRAAGCAAGGG